MIRLGYINYANCYPFYYSMFEKEKIKGTQIISDHPSALNSMMQSGQLDISPISSAAYPDMQDNVLLLPNYCLSSIGYVRSVILISNMPIEELDRKIIGMSIASKTSVILSKILFSKYYNINPLYTTSSPLPTLESLDAALVIGNEAMTNIKEAIPYTYDLGDLWLRKTGYAVVFAIFAVKKNILELNKDKFLEITSSFNKSLSCLTTERNKLIKCANKKYPQISFDLDAYYNLLKFEFTNELKSSLSFYFSEACELGFLKKAGNLNFLESF